MAYCTAAQVQAEFKDITFSSTTSVTSTDVDRFIAESDAEIDARVNGVYQTPITGTTSLIIVRTISIWLTKDRIQRILIVKDGQDPDKQEGGPTLRDQAIKMLDDIVARTVDLSDATLVTSTDGVRSYNSDNSVDRIFKRDTVQW